MRRRDPNQLTERERDVLELLQRDFTNEQIASRLGISLDGAKYHVSQILSKLGVATREEAAAVALGERNRWWARWPLWAKIVGAATSAAAVAGLATLVFNTGSSNIEEMNATALGRGGGSESATAGASPTPCALKPGEVFRTHEREILTFDSERGFIDKQDLGGYSVCPRDADQP